MSSEAPVNPAVSRLLAIARERKLDTVWDRHRAMQPQCGFGQTGACCHACWKGPCRTDPFGNGPTQGICGASTDTIVARGLVRMIAAGTASHADHGRHLAHALRRVARGEASSHAIRDERKLLAVAARLGIEANGRDANAVAAELAERSLEDFGSQEEDRELTWAKASLSPERIARLAELGVLPHNIDGTVTQLMARTHVGCDADPVNLVLSGVKGAIADCAGMCLATEISDILFGTPRPTVTAANLGVLRADSVNIALNGHNPLLPEVICDVAAEMSEAARRAGAPGGINVVGVCCTGNEVMNRRGIPLAANYLSQEMVLLTGAVDAMVLDVQCIMPSLAQIGACFHTAVITTADDNKIPGAIHMPFQITEAKAVARKVVGSAIEAFGRRDPARVAIPAAKEVSRVGYSAEAVLEALSALNPRDPLEPLANALCSGAIKGIVLFNGCNTPSVPQDSSFIQIAKRLARENVLLLASGCGAGAFAKAGFMTGRAVEAYAGASLAGFLRDVGEAAGLGEPMPLVLHMDLRRQQPSDDAGARPRAEVGSGPRPAPVRRVRAGADGGEGHQHRDLVRRARHDDPYRNHAPHHGVVAGGGPADARLAGALRRPLHRRDRPCEGRRCHRGGARGAQARDGWLRRGAQPSGSRPGRRQGLRSCVKAADTLTGRWRRVPP